MDVRSFVKIIGADFFAGVPDSQLKALCDYLTVTYGTDPAHHIIAANEGNCAAIAAGYHLATGKVPVVYMQNSGEGNIINPAASLLSDKVYGIPVLFVIGWRGEPGVHDEPQHVYQGEVTVKLLEDMDIKPFVVSKETTEEELSAAMEAFGELFARGKDAAFVIKKGALTFDEKVSYSNGYAMTREEIIRHIVRFSGEDPVVSTTGKASRELFEIREAAGQGHKYDFLTVGSMGHTSSIALGIALNKPNAKVWCIDGDGSAVMHMGSLAVNAKAAPENLVHIVINNGAHETVGGMPTAADNMSIAQTAKACGYRYTARVEKPEELDRELDTAKKRGGLCMIEVMCSIGARADLGRPTTKAIDNKREFAEYLKSI